MRNSSCHNPPMQCMNSLKHDTVFIVVAKPFSNCTLNSLSWEFMCNGEFCIIVCLDLACYIYTSGTTGLPKACNIKHTRLVIGHVGILKDRVWRSFVSWLQEVKRQLHNVFVNGWSVRPGSTHWVTSYHHFVLLLLHIYIHSWSLYADFEWLVGY